jgi:hypothetical protein
MIHRVSCVSAEQTPLSCHRTSQINILQHGLMSMDKYRTAQMYTAVCTLGWATGCGRHVERLVHPLISTCPQQRFTEVSLLRDGYYCSVEVLDYTHSSTQTPLRFVTDTDMLVAHENAIIGDHIGSPHLLTSSVYSNLGFSHPRGFYKPCNLYRHPLVLTDMWSVHLYGFLKPSNTYWHVRYTHAASTMSSLTYWHTLVPYW